MQLEPIKSAGIFIRRQPKLAANQLIFIISCLLLVALAGLAGCSYAVPQYTYQKPSQETPGVTLKSPEIILLNIDNMTLSTEGLNLNMQTKVLNPNPFSIDLDNLKVFTRDAAGVDNMLNIIPGGSIESISVRTFNFGTVLPNRLLFERKQTIGISTQTVNTDKILPVSATTEINIPEVLNNLIINPKITSQANITKISWNGLSAQLEAQVEGNIHNSNPLSLHYNLISILIKDNKGGVIAADNISSDSVAANSDYPFKRSLILPIQVMNETGVTVYIEATIQIPNYLQTFRGSAALPIPKLRELISIPQINLDTSAMWVTTLPPPFFEMTILTLINNDNKLDLTTGDLKVNIYKADDTLIGSKTMTSDTIKGIRNSSTKTLTNWISLSPDTIGPLAVDSTITAETNVGLEGVYEKIPLNASMVLKLTPQDWPY